MSMQIDTLAGRIRKCAEIVGSGDDLSRKAGIPRSTLETYLTGNSEPKASRLLAIANAAEVSLDWLVAGRGEMRPSELGDEQGDPPTLAYTGEAALQVFPVSKIMMAQATDCIVRLHKEMGISLAPVRQGELVYEILEDIVRASESPEEYGAQLEIMLGRLKRKLKAAIAEPGTGKHSASAS